MNALQQSKRKELAPAVLFALVLVTVPHMLIQPATACTHRMCGGCCHAVLCLQTLQRMGGALPPQLIQQMGGMGGLQQLRKAMDGMDKGGRLR